MTVKYQYFHDKDNVVKFLNKLIAAGYDLKTSILSMTESGGRTTIYYLSKD